jgi:hypothetical protein
MGTQKTQQQEIDFNFVQSELIKIIDQLPNFENFTQVYDYVFYSESIKDDEYYRVKNLVLDGLWGLHCKLIKLDDAELLNLYNLFEDKYSFEDIKNFKLDSK